MSSISRKEEICELYENLHNLLWNEEGFNPEKALEHLNFFIFLKIIEPHLSTGKISLSEKCKFSNLAKIEDDHVLFDVFNSEVMPEICNNSLTNPYFKFIDIKHCLCLRKIIDQIDRIDIANSDLDLLGAVYEYIIGRGSSDMSDAGQYFTNREICDLAVKLCIDDTSETPSSICDPFCGTGGFLISYIKRMNKCGETDYWEKHLYDVYGNDIKIGNVMSTMLNLLCHTGIPFSDKTITQGDSFRENIFNRKFSLILTNPPFGGDKDVGENFKFKYGEGSGNNYTHKVNKVIREIDIRIDSKSAVALQLCMGLLEKDGACGIVLDEGFFFGVNKNLIREREYLIENFNVEYIVDIPQDAFENTSTKTNLMIFRNNGSTEVIKFLKFRSDEIIAEVGIEKLRERGYSLNYKRYSERKWNLKDGYELFKLANIAILNPENMTNGEFSNIKYIELSDIYNGRVEVIKTFNVTDAPSRAKRKVKVNDIIIGTVRPNLKKHMYISDKIYCENLIVSTGFCVIRSDQAIVCPKYLFFLLIGDDFTSILTEQVTGSSYPAVNTEIIKNLNIPLPSLKEQEKFINLVDGYFEAIDDGINIIRNLEKALSARATMIVYQNSHQMMKLSQICNFMKKSSHPASYGKEKGKYRFYVSSQEKVRYCDTYDYEDECIIIGTGGNANIHIGSKFSASMHMAVITPKNGLYLPFIYYLLKGNIDLLKNGFNGTALKFISKEYLSNLELPIPDLSLQMTLKEDHDYINLSKIRIKEFQRIVDEQLETLRLPDDSLPDAPVSEEETLENSSPPSPESESPPPIPKNLNHEEPNLESMDLEALKKYAKTLGVKSAGSYKKKENLIKKIKEQQASKD